MTDVKAGRGADCGGVAGSIPPPAVLHRRLHHRPRARTRRQVREQISSEMWEQLNRLFHRSEARRRRRSLGRARFSPRHQGRRASVSGHHRFHHDPRRRLAVHSGRPFSGARRPRSRRWWACISANFTRTDVGAGAPRMDRPAALLHRLRSVLQGLHRGPAPGPHRRISGAAIRVFPHSIRFSADALETR